MFLNGQGLPKPATESELTIEVSKKESEEFEINTNAQPVSAFSRDIKAYVLDEFKDILFPKQKNKYE